MASSPNDATSAAANPFQQPSIELHSDPLTAFVCGAMIASSNLAWWEWWLCAFEAGAVGVSVRAILPEAELVCSGVPRAHLPVCGDECVLCLARRNLACAAVVGGIGRAQAPAPIQHGLQRLFNVMISASVPAGLALDTPRTQADPASPRNATVTMKISTIYQMRADRAKAARGFSADGAMTRGRGCF